MPEMEFTSRLEAKLVQRVGDDLSVARAAWVSTKGERAEDEKDPARVKGLINFLMHGRHGTPFEHAQLTFLVKAPIFVFREFHRHRIGWSYNEESGRYTQLRPKFYVPDHGRPLVQVGRPGAYEFVQGDETQVRLTQDAVKVQSANAYSAYERLLGAGVAKEVARMTLPVNIYSSMYATCNPRSLMSFLSLRTHSDGSMFPSFPMHEIEVVATQMEQALSIHFPFTYEAWHSGGRVAP